MAFAIRSLIDEKFPFAASTNAFVTLTLSFAPGRYFGFPGIIVRIGASVKIFSIYFLPILLETPGTL